MKKRATNRIYIAYGSNMNLGQMEYRCPGARVIGKATLDGWRLVFQGRPGNAHANILEDPTASTPVLVWEISEANEATLDIYEGVRGGYYRKHYLPVTVDGKTYEGALVYLMSPNPFHLPTSAYFDGIVQGYQASRIEIRPLQEALAYSATRAGKEVI